MSSAWPRLRWTMLAAIAGFSLLAVYCTYVSLHVRDLGTGVAYDQQSIQEYRQALQGIRAFPYQWRLLGIYLVRGAEKVTGRDPNAVDAAVKFLLLCVSSTLLFQYARAYATEVGALAVVALYLVLDVASFTDGYSIYYTNDYAVVAAWFAAVFLVRERRFAAAAALTFVGAFAKETMLLVPVLVGLEWLRRRATFGQVVLVALAFAVPTAFLRSYYRTSLSHWAWWDMVFANVPLLQSSRAELLMTLKNNVKVFLFFNVLWIAAARAVLRTRDVFQQDLALTAIVYLGLAYPVIYIRELRHFLPLAILVLPLAIAELERASGDRMPQPGRTR